MTITQYKGTCNLYKRPITTYSKRVCEDKLTNMHIIQLLYNLSLFRRIYRLHVVLKKNIQENYKIL